MATSNLSSDSIASLAMEKNVVVKTIEPYVLPSSLITSYAFDRFTEAWVKLRGWEVEGYVLYRVNVLLDCFTFWTTLTVDLHAQKLTNIQV